MENLLTIRARKFYEERYGEIGHCAIFTAMADFADLIRTEGQDWVPVEKKLPTPLMKVWVTIVDTAWKLPVVRKGCYDSNKGEWLELLDVFMPLSNSACVVAWKPIEKQPQPFECKD